MFEIASSSSVKDLLKVESAQLFLYNEGKYWSKNQGNSAIIYAASEGVVGACGASSNVVNSSYSTYKKSEVDFSRW